MKLSKKLLVTAVSSNCGDFPSRKLDFHEERLSWWKILSSLKSATAWSGGTLSAIAELHKTWTKLSYNFELETFTFPLIFYHQHCRFFSKHIFIKFYLLVLKSECFIFIFCGNGNLKTCRFLNLYDNCFTKIKLVLTCVLKKQFHFFTFIAWVFCRN